MKIIVLAAVSLFALLNPEVQAAPGARVEAKEAEIILPKIELREATLDEAVEAVVKMSREHDPRKQGVNVFLKLSNPNTAKVTLSLKNVAVSQALRYIADLSGLMFSKERGAFVLSSAK